MLFCLKVRGSSFKRFYVRLKTPYLNSTSALASRFNRTALYLHKDCAIFVEEISPGMTVVGKVSNL